MDSFAAAARQSLPGMIDDDESLLSIMEKGTVNIEGCAGIVGLGTYFQCLSNLASRPENDPSASTAAPAACCTGEGARTSASSQISTTLSLKEAKNAYLMIRKVEDHLLNAVAQQFDRYPRVRILKSIQFNESQTLQLPTVSFLHSDLSSHEIVEECSKNGITCRSGSFLSTPFLFRDFEVDRRDGVVRISLAHYNTEEEVRHLFQVLESIPGW